ncbi:MAG TPA: HAD family phosphatase [Candidatus Limnocylindrales bacterium]|nr:HAD family phosphatase [Candidatus Limnocylindrales bacterium]
MKIPKNIKAVIFDLDGLLIDSEPYWTESIALLFKKQKKKFSIEYKRKAHGRGAREAIEVYKREAGLVGDTDELVAERRSILYKILLPNVSLMTGAAKIVESMHKKGLKLAIATGGYPKEKLVEILRKLQILDFFIIIVSSDEVKKGKPEPDVFLEAAKRLRVNPAECLVFEDAPSGVLAGKAAGMTVYAVNSDQSIQEELKKAGADSVFSSLAEIKV